MQSTAQPGYLAHGFIVSISYDDGENWSTELEYIIYDPVCQDPVSDVSGHFSVQIKVCCDITTISYCVEIRLFSVESCI